METVTVTLFSFSELSDAAQGRACSDYRHAGHDYFWLDDYMASAREFCGAFRVKITDYSIGTCSYSYVKTDAEARNFRGRKLREFDPDYMPTGFCADADLWNTFYQVFKTGGDAKAAFDAAMDKWLKALIADMEYQESDEAIGEHLSMNNYRFTEAGKSWH